MKNVVTRMDIFFDHNAPSIVTELPAYRDGYLDILRRGGEIRCLTEITKENIEYAKKLESLVTELRHFDGLKGGLAINGNEYMATSILQEKKPLIEVVYSNVSAMVEQGQLIFDTFWDKGIPASQKIRELEEGLEPVVIETIREAARIQKMGNEMGTSAVHEILIIFSTANAFRRQIEAGLIDILQKAVQKPRMAVKILTPIDQNTEKAMAQWTNCQLNNPDFRKKAELRTIEDPLHTKLSILVVDRVHSLTIELKDDTKATSLEAMGMATYSNNKATVLTYCTIFDALWKQTELYAEIKSLYDQLQSQTILQREFIDIAAHELRTPIQPILGMSEVLADYLATTGEPKKMIDVIIRNAKRLQQLQEDILDVSKIENHSLNFRKEHFDLDEVLAPAIEDAKSHIGRTVSIVFERNAHAQVFADKNRLMQVVSNLLGNATKFTKAGTIRIILDRTGNQAVVTIKDTGVGIDPGMFSKLFTKFATGSRSGTGLGLYIVKSIIEAHGGSIVAENNTDGQGAAFSFTLPTSNT